MQDEYRKLKQQEEKLINYKNEFNSQSQQFTRIFNKNEETMKDLNTYCSNVDQEIEMIKEYNESNKGKEIVSNNVMSFIQISNPDIAIIKVIAVEACAEDYIAIGKKYFERGDGKFDDFIKFMRKLSLEMFKVKYYKEKLLFGRK